MLLLLFFLSGNFHHCYKVSRCYNNTSCYKSSHLPSFITIFSLFLYPSPLSSSLTSLHFLDLLLLSQLPLYSLFHLSKPFPFFFFFLSFFPLPRSPPPSLTPHTHTLFPHSFIIANWLSCLWSARHPSCLRRALPLDFIFTSYSSNQSQSVKGLHAHY